MEGPARMPGKPGACPFMPASGLAVQDGMDRDTGGNAALEELPAAGGALSNDRARAGRFRADSTAA